MLPLVPVRPGDRGRSPGWLDPRMASLETLHPFGEGDLVRMIVEAPRGAPLKLKYEPKVGLFTVSRALPLGLSYPFDWGFVPGTRAADGDPVDALALHDGGTYPGVLLECRPLGVVEIEQDGHNGREANPRLVLVPAWNERAAEVSTIEDLSERLKQEIEHFFLDTTFFTAKNATITGWEGPEAARKLVRRSTAIQ